MDRLSGPGTRTERAALRSAILTVTHVQKLVASRGDEELLEALSALAEPLEYLARRSEFDVTSEILERPRRLPARDTEPPSEKAEDQSEAEPGEVISESAD
jgi:hypothetical protein